MPTIMTEFVYLVLGHAPLILGAVFILAATRFIIKRWFPEFGERLNATYDALMGVDEHYDAKHETDYAYPPRWK